MNTKEILIAARAKIEKPENWLQQSLAEDAQGFSCSVGSPDAVSFCALGALCAVGGDYPRAFVYLEDQILGGGLVRFNNTHTHAEVLDLFDRAIASCE